MSGRVFISHCSADRAVALEICRRVENRGVRCWIAPRDVSPGEDYALRIGTELDKAIGFVVVLSRESSRSRFVKAETEYAFSNGGLPIFPVRVEAIDKNDLDPGLKLFVGSSHIVDAIPAFRDAALNRLAQDIARKTGRKEGTRTAHGSALQTSAAALLGADCPMFLETWRDMDRRDSQIAWIPEALIGGPLWPFARGMTVVGVSVTAIMALMVFLTGSMGGAGAAIVALSAVWILTALVFGAFGAGWLRRHIVDRLGTNQSEPSRGTRLGAAAGSLLILMFAVLTPDWLSRPTRTVAVSAPVPAAASQSAVVSPAGKADGVVAKSGSPAGNTARGRQADFDLIMEEQRKEQELRDLEMLQMQIEQEALAAEAEDAAAAFQSPSSEITNIYAGSIPQQ